MNYNRIVLYFQRVFFYSVHGVSIYFSILGTMNLKSTYPDLPGTMVTMAVRELVTTPLIHVYRLDSVSNHA